MTQAHSTRELSSQFLMTPMYSLTYTGVIWCILVYSDVYWCILVYSGVFWCILVYSGVFVIQAYIPNF